MYVTLNNKTNLTSHLCICHHIYSSLCRILLPFNFFIYILTGYYTGNLGGRLGHGDNEACLLPKSVYAMHLMDLRYVIIFEKIEKGKRMKGRNRALETSSLHLHH